MNEQTYKNITRSYQSITRYFNHDMRMLMQDIPGYVEVEGVDQPIIHCDGEDNVLRDSYEYLRNAHTPKDVFHIMESFYNGSLGIGITKDIIHKTSIITEERKEKYRTKYFTDVPNGNELFKIYTSGDKSLYEILIKEFGMFPNPPEWNKSICYRVMVFLILYPEKAILLDSNVTNSLYGQRLLQNGKSIMESLSIFMKFVIKIIKSICKYCNDRNKKIRFILCNVKLRHKVKRDTSIVDALSKNGFYKYLIMHTISEDDLTKMHPYIRQHEHGRFSANQRVYYKAIDGDSSHIAYGTFDSIYKLGLKDHTILIKGLEKWEEVKVVKEATEHNMITLDIGESSTLTCITETEICGYYNRYNKAHTLFRAISYPIHNIKVESSCISGHSNANDIKYINIEPPIYDTSYRLITIDRKSTILDINGFLVKVDSGIQKQKENLYTHLANILNKRAIIAGDTLDIYFNLNKLLLLGNSSSVTYADIVSHVTYIGYVRKYITYIKNVISSLRYYKIKIHLVGVYEMWNTFKYLKIEEFSLYKVQIQGINIIKTIIDTLINDRDLKQRSISFNICKNKKVNYLMYAKDYLHHYEELASYVNDVTYHNSIIYQDTSMHPDSLAQYMHSIPLLFGLHYPILVINSNMTGDLTESQFIRELMLSIDRRKIQTYRITTSQ